MVLLRVPPDHVRGISLFEGWFGAIDSFIHEVRRMNPDTVIFYYCLDPVFPALENTKRFMSMDTHKQSISTRRAGESRTVDISPLAVDIDTFSQASSIPNRYRHLASVPVFVGSVLGLSTKRDLRDMLREAVPFGPVYGKGWESDPEFAPYCKGVLPMEDLADVYRASGVVLGATMDAKRDAGMVNNRVFEVMATGTAFISDHFEALEAIFGDLVLYHKKRGDTAMHIQRALSQKGKRRPSLGRQYSWDDRVDSIIRFYAHIVRQRVATPLEVRSNHPRLAVLSSNDIPTSSAALVDALEQLHGRTYRVSACTSACGESVCSPQKHAAISSTCSSLTGDGIEVHRPCFAGVRAFDVCDPNSVENAIVSGDDNYDIILIHDLVCGTLDTFMRSLKWAPRAIRPKVIFVTNERREGDCGHLMYDVAIHETGASSPSPDENAPSFFADAWHRGIDALPVAISRAMCFGSFTESSVKITSPREGEHIPYANLIRVEYDITNFGIRVDGGMCMKASGDVDNATQICAYQPAHRYTLMPALRLNRFEIAERTSR